MQTATMPNNDRCLSSEDITSLSTLHVRRLKVQTPAGEIVDRVEVTDTAPIDALSATHTLPLKKPDAAQLAAFIQYVFAIGYRAGLADEQHLSLN